MTLFYTLFAFLLSVPVHCDHKPWGGVQLITKQEGLNTATEYLQDHFAYALRTQDFQEHRILKNTIVNNIHVTATSGTYTEVTIEGNNTLRLNAGFADCFVQANVTIIRAKDVLRSPETVVNFENVGISTQIIIGQGGDGKEIAISDCHLNIGGLELVDASAEAQRFLEAYITIAQQQIHGMVSKMCAGIEKLLRTKYKDILDIEGEFSVRGDGPIQYEMDYRLNNITASHGKIILTTALGLKGTMLPDYGSHDVQFPDPAELGYDNRKEVELWLNSDLLGLLFMKALEVEKVIPRSLAVFETDRHDFKIIVLQELDTSIETTKYGIALRLSRMMTILQARTGVNAYCVDMTVNVTAVLPFRIQINNTWAEFHPDPDRFHIDLAVLKEDVAYTDCASINPKEYPVRYEKKVLQEFLKEFEKYYNHRFLQMRLFTDRFIGFQNTSIDTLQDSAIITANLARSPDIAKEETIQSFHKLYKHRVITFTYTNTSSETYIDNKLVMTGFDATSASSIITWNSCTILMLFVSALLRMCFSLMLSGGLSRFIGGFTLDNITVEPVKLSK